MIKSNESAHVMMESDNVLAEPASVMTQPVCVMMAVSIAVRQCHDRQRWQIGDQVKALVVRVLSLWDGRRWPSAVSHLLPGPPLPPRSVLPALEVLTSLLEQRSPEDGPLWTEQIVAHQSPLSVVVAAYCHSCCQAVHLSIRSLILQVASLDSPLALRVCTQPPVSYTHLTLPTKRIV
eukprot:TRINITY_DN13096_c0_g1_i2.p1 TRINITY_DN13096_c0_g1~~TRINITY_DN13096_c0_g1_i2.p1  ORF type:complete len:178 (+),score=33.27 TRINITY_DN13096_c0_g1_i2:69-602(+)